MRKELRPAQGYEPAIFFFLLLSALIPFLVYLLTLYPSVAGGDSGELVAAVCEMGIPHPPGYPLFVLLAKPFTWIPIHSLAWRVNLFSAFWNALAAATLFAGVARWTKNRWAALSASLLFSFSPLIWHYSTQAEVFGLNHFLAALLLLFAVLFREKQDWKWALATSFVFGLGLSHHHTILFFGAPILGWMVWNLREKEKFTQKVFWIGIVGVVGLTPYLYLPLAAARAPLMSWGNVGSFSGLMKHFLRTEYGTFQLATSGGSEGVFSYLISYFGSLFGESLWFGPIIATFGIVWFWKKDLGARGFLRLLLVIYGSYLIIFHSLANLPTGDFVFLSILSRFWQLPNLIVFFWIGLGFAALASKTQRRTLVPLIGLGAAFLQLGIHYQSMDNHRNTVVSDYGRAILTTLPLNSVLLTKGDLQLNSVRYFSVCEGVRKDVVITDRSMLTYPWARRNLERNYPDFHLPPGEYLRAGGYALDSLILANQNQRPVFFLDLDDSEKGEEESLKKMEGFKKIEFAFVNRMVPVNSFQLSEYYSMTEDAFSKLDPAMMDRYSALPWEGTIRKVYFDKKNNQAMDLTLFGDQNHDVHALKLGAESWEKLITIQQHVHPWIYKNLAVTYGRMGVKEKALQYWEEFLKRSSSDDPDRKNAENEIRALKAKIGG